MSTKSATVEVRRDRDRVLGSSAKEVVESPSQLNEAQAVTVDAYASTQTCLRRRLPPLRSRLTTSSGARAVDWRGDAATGDETRRLALGASRLSSTQLSVGQSPSEARTGGLRQDGGHRCRGGSRIVRVGAGPLAARIDRRFAFSAFARSATRSLSRASRRRIPPSTALLCTRQPPLESRL
jgi:hypothetical protein